MDKKDDKIGYLEVMAFARSLGESILDYTNKEIIEMAVLRHTKGEGKNEKTQG